MRLRQDQWNWIFSYIFTMLVALVYAAVFWWIGASWWLAALFAHNVGYTWNRKFPGTSADTSQTPGTEA